MEEALAAILDEAAARAQQEERLELAAAQEQSAASGADQAISGDSRGAQHTSVICPCDNLPSPLQCYTGITYMTHACAVLSAHDCYASTFSVISKLTFVRHITDTQLVTMLVDSRIQVGVSM